MQFSARFYVTGLFFFFLFISVTCDAQFRGGADDGYSLSVGLGKSLGQNIFTGGADDGYSLSSATSQNLGQNIFKGGNDDGYSLSSATSQNLGQNIFKGGNDDGYSLSSATSQNLGQNIFKGGNDDGYTLSLGSNQPLGTNIFTGGDNDGWAFAMASNLVLLPVVLKSFDADWLNQEDIITKWITSSEANTDHFEVERSTNGTSFEFAGNVVAAGNSTTERSYSFADVNVNSHYTVRPDRFYYRLKTVDADGRVSYSAIVVLPNKQQTNSDQFVVYPNPAQQYLTLEFKSTTRIISPHVVQLFNAEGKLLMQKNMADQKETINVGRYPSGNYFIRLLQPATNVSQSIKFIIQH